MSELAMLSGCEPMFGTLGARVQLFANHFVLRAHGDGPAAYREPVCPQHGSAADKIRLCTWSVGSLRKHWSRAEVMATRIEVDVVIGNV